MQIIHKIDHIYVLHSNSSSSILPKTNTIHFENLDKQRAGGISILEIGWCRFHGRHVWLNPAEIGRGRTCGIFDELLEWAAERKRKIFVYSEEEGDRCRHPATTGSIEFRWITIARGCNGKRTLTSPVVGVLASSIPSSIQLSVVQHSPLVRARTTLVLLGKRSNPLVSPRTKTTSLFFSKPPEP